MPFRFILMLLTGLLVNANCLAQGIVLDYPSGRFQEDKPPTLFRWSLSAPVSSLTFKLFQRDADGTLDKIKNLVARFDFIPEGSSLPWTQTPFLRGQYVWSIDGYDATKPEPLFHEELEFEVAPAVDLDLRSARFGLQVGFSRGNYTGSDSNYGVEFQTTPTIYGILWRGGSEKRIWDLSAAMNDFTIRGQVKQTFSANAAYSFRLSNPNSKRVDLFLGPYLRLFSFPRMHTVNGTDLSSTSVTQVSPGALFSIQKRFDFKITLYSQIFADLPVAATVPSTTSTEQMGYGGSGGIIFGQFWPLALGGEIQYRVDKSSTIDGGERINMQMDGWSLIANMVYALPDF